ncbi:MAG: ABC transporter permease [Elusimicrobia bacterium]|nr:ABC transporter permease [Elusimicrobiota bacterium]
MSRLGILAWSSLREQLRDRSYQLALLFAGVMIYLSLLLGMLAVDQELRALLDFGLGFIELMALAAAIFGAATGILREMETKAIYLVLTRPVTRLQYLVGRYLGIVLSTAAAVGLMAVVHVALLLIRGWEFRPDYLLALFGIGLKVAIAAAIATLFALFSTSALSALTITGVLWTLGHFLPEMRFLAQRGGFPSIPLLVALKVTPNLQLLSFRERLDVPAAAWAGEPVAFAIAYCAAYSAVCLTLAYALLRTRDL